MQILIKRNTSNKWVWEILELDVLKNKQFFFIILKTEYLD